jgi:hypothetical protein
MAIRAASTAQLEAEIVALKRAIRQLRRETGASEIEAA